MNTAEERIRAEQRNIHALATGRNVQPNQKESHVRNDESTRTTSGGIGSRIRNVNPVRSGVPGETRPATQRSHADILDLLIRELQLVPVDAEH